MFFSGQILGSPSIQPPVPPPPPPSSVAPPPPHNDFYIPPTTAAASVPFTTTNFLPTGPLLPQLSNNILRPISSNDDPRIHSTVEQSDQSDDEDIDVVKSAFVPIKPASVLLKEIQQQHPDSTVQDKDTIKQQEHNKCDLKAPSSKSIKNMCSPNTKLHSPQTNNTKSVWRPY